MREIKFEVETEIPALRFVNVICPGCKNKFDARAHGKRDDGTTIHDVIDLRFAKFTCPNCNHDFQTRGQKIEII